MTTERDREMEDYKGWGTSHMSFKSGEGVHAQLTASYMEGVSLALFVTIVM
jgi:hypothetical protein